MGIEKEKENLQSNMATISSDTVAEVASTVSDKKSSVKSKDDSQSKSFVSGHSTTQEALVSELDKDYNRTKSLLLTRSTKTGMNLYDHLVSVLSNILTHQPLDFVDIFEDLSWVVKREKFTSQTSTVQEDPLLSTETALALIQRNLYDVGDKGEEEAATEEDVETVLPDLLLLNYFFEQSGLGLNREEMYRIWMSLKELAKPLPLVSIRFWGKVFGVEQNYYVAEVEFEEGEGDEADHQEEEAGKELEEEAKPEYQGTGEEGEAELEHPLPRPKWKPPPVVPTEEFGTGVNRKVYYVCNEPGKLWQRLPKVTPAQIQVSRKIKKYLTGYLDSPIVSYPPFPGVEKHYLRAQIARISATTQVSPMGLYQFDTEEEDEEGLSQGNCVRSPGFEGLALSELIDPSLENWVHHDKFLLRQGRCVWWNPKELDEEMMEEIEEGPEPEIGSPLLQPLSEDRLVHQNPPWTVHLSTKRTPQYAHAHISSNLWPGASAFSASKYSENIYVAWGHKYSENNYSPPPPPPVMQEYRWGPELVEVSDPTPEEEAALKALLEPPQAPEGEEDQEEEEEEEEEEGEEEDED